MTDQCQKCGRSRARGWILVNGLCLRCGPFEFYKRRNELKEQARKLREEGE